MPAEIQPGEAVRFSFEFRAPAAGIRRESVSIFADGAEEPLAILRPAILAKITPPRIVGIPAEYRVHLLRGQDFESELLVVSIEKRGSPNLIQEVHIRPAGLLSVRIAEVREQRSIDPDFVNRSYRLVVSSLEIAVAPAGQQAGLLWFTTVPAADVGEATGRTARATGGDSCTIETNRNRRRGSSHFPFVAGEENRRASGSAHRRIR